MPKIWRLSEKHYVKDHYQTLGAVRIAAELGRSVWAVRHKARQLGVIAEPNAPYRWRAARKDAFCAAYRRSPEEAARRFGLTRMSANSYASRWRCLVRRPWTEAEDYALRRFWPSHEDETLRLVIDRSDASIRCRAHKLGLRRQAVHGWTGWRFADQKKPQGDHRVTTG